METKSVILPNKYKKKYIFYKDTQNLLITNIIYISRAAPDGLNPSDPDMAVLTDTGSLYFRYP